MSLRLDPKQIASQHTGLRLKDKQQTAPVSTNGFHAQSRQIVKAEVTKCDAASAHAAPLQFLRSDRIASKASREKYFLAESWMMPNAIRKIFSFTNENLSISMKRHIWFGSSSEKQRIGKIVPVY